MRSIGLSPEAERALNFVGLLAVLAVLIGANAYQFIYRELPCTLCLLQRLAMIGVAYGAAMNLMLGPSHRFYSVSIVSAVFGIAISARQSLLHINPYFDTETDKPTLEPTTNPAFGNPILGLDLYVWGIIVFGSVFLAIGLVRMFRSRPEEAKEEPRWLTHISTFGVGLLFVVAAFQTLTVFAECGFGDCPNDGGWNWWLFS